MKGDTLVTSTPSVFLCYALKLKFLISRLKLFGFMRFVCCLTRDYLFSLTTIKTLAYLGK